MKRKWSIVAGIVVLLVAHATATFADKPVKLIVNGYEIKPDIPPQLINGRTIPIRWAAEALGAEVQWDERANAVRINSSQCPAPKPLTKEQIETIIRAQGKHKDSYYVDGLSYDVANLDDDADWEIVAKIDGAVHLGNFFILDKDSSGDYKLMAEQDWKVEQFLDDPIEIDGKRLFKLVTRTGGTGVDVFTVHLWYLEQGEFKEVWQGTLKERSMMAGPETFYMKVGGFQIDVEGKRLYAWETSHRLDQDGVTPIGDLKTSTKVYLFNGTSFIQEESEKADPAPTIIVEEEREVIPNTLVVTKTISDYAHGQHIIWVEGRFKNTEGELYLTLLDGNGQQLQSSGGIYKSDEVKQIDDEWSFFRHKLIEDTGKVVETDKLTIVFHLNKEGKNQKGFLNVPAKKPEGIFAKDTGKLQDVSNTHKNIDNKNWEVVSRVYRVQGTILKLAMTEDELRSIVLKVTKTIERPQYVPGLRLTKQKIKSTS